MTKCITHILNACEHALTTFESANQSCFFGEMMTTGALLTRKTYFSSGPQCGNVTASPRFLCVTCLHAFHTMCLAAQLANFDRRPDTHTYTLPLVKRNLKVHRFVHTSPRDDDCAHLLKEPLTVTACLFSKAPT